MEIGSITPSVNPKKLWEPTSVENTHMYKFMLTINNKFGLNLKSYDELYTWSIDNISDFWSSVWTYTSIISSSPPTSVIDESAPMRSIPTWFPSSLINFAENLLVTRSSTKLALIETGEMGLRARLTYGELYDSVARLTDSLRKMGVGKNDIVAAYIPNCHEAIVGMLATVALGAIWSSTSPDFGATGVLDRFVQIKPKVLISVDAVVYNGKVLDHMGKLKSVVDGLESLEKVIVVHYVKDRVNDLTLLGPKAIMWKDFIDTADSSLDLTFTPVPFSHPAFILFSSGTTGKPKCIVHSGGGLLLQMKKEHIIHGDMTSEDVFFYYTTTGWMMWNWLVSGLSVGCTLVLWDGSPFKPEIGTLFNLVDEYGITIFGTSAKYIQYLQDTHYKPREHHSLTTLRTIYSTGSPLKPESYDFVYEHIKPSILLGSITGGTDICSLFGAHNCALPVYRGEIQCCGLGMAIEARDDQGHKVNGVAGDLVCVKVFPCMPVYFLNDPEKEKYMAAYFSVFPDIWYHGDYIWINPNTGGLVMLGRSDGTLNPAGVRFGSAEIYNIVDSHFSDLVEDSLCVGQVLKDQPDERVVLFLKVKGHKATEEGRKGIVLDEVLVKNIKERIRKELSPRHVPAFVIGIADIPYTVNGKKVEVAVKKIISGQKFVPSGTLANPECLDLYYGINELQQ